MASAPVPSVRTHSFPNGKPLLLSLLELFYLGTAVAWFLYWWMELGFRSWWCGLPIVFIVIAFAIIQSRLLAHYEQTGDAVRISSTRPND